MLARGSAAGFLAEILRKPNEITSFEFVYGSLNLLKLLAHWRASPGAQVFTALRLPD